MRSPRAASRPNQHGRRQVGRRPGDGAARRHADAGRPGRWAPSRSPGCRTPWRATPTTGARCWAASSCCWCWLFPQGIAGFDATTAWLDAEQAACRRKRRRIAAVAAAGGEGMSLLKVNELGKSFGGNRAVDGISFERCGRRTAGADRPQRRRQVDHLQHGQRPAAGRPRLDPARRRRADRRASRATSGAWASAAPSRSPRPSRR